VADESQAPAERSEPERESHLGRKLVLVVLVAVVVLASYVFVVSVLPRWWAQQVGDQVDGDLTTGGLLGFTYGFLAAFLPLLVLGFVWRFWRRSGWAWVLGVGLAILLAIPNLVTLGIALGTGSAAHAADRTLDVQAPWFRGGMVVGVAVALLLAAFLAWVLGSRARARESAREAHERLATPPE
jgi:glucan phosphoethanolaminetransferase (alkaline phosphatase superfamily)